MEDHWRNILPIIASHASLQTCGRLKQMCKLFNSVLKKELLHKIYWTDPWHTKDRHDKILSYLREKGAIE